MSLKYTQVTQSSLCLIFSLCAGTMHHLNYSEQESKKNYLQIIILTYV